jgi:hypothetical protein
MHFPDKLDGKIWPVLLDLVQAALRILEPSELAERSNQDGIA